MDIAGITESDDAYHIRIEAPGYSKDNIDIEVDKDNIIHISGVRNLEKEEKHNNLFQERQQADFHKSFMLLKAIQQDAITATCHDGVLQI